VSLLRLLLLLVLLLLLASPACSKHVGVKNTAVLVKQ
jgi:hypothetical protein